MAITKPFQELLERLGRVEDDKVVICYQSSAQGFKVKKTLVKHADLVVETLNDLKANIWYEINPSDTDQRAKADNITRLSALWIDIDYKDTGIQSPSNAHELVDLIAELIGVAPTAVIASGHGLQPYWAIDPEEDYTQEMAAGVLQRWGGFAKWLAASQGGALDSVFDLPRIFRAPGSINFKDATNPIQVGFEFPDNWRPLSLFEIDDVLIAHGFTSVATMPTEFEQVAPSDQWAYADADCHWIGHLLASTRPQQPPKSRHGWLLQQLIKVNAAHRNGCITKETASLLTDTISTQFVSFLKLAPAREMHKGEIHAANRWAIAKVETFDDLKLSEELRGHIHKDLFSGDQPPTELSAIKAEGEYSDDELIALYEATFNEFGRTDSMNAFRFIAFMRQKYKHVTDIGWHYWNGQRYVVDTNKSIIQTSIDSAKFAAVCELEPEQLAWQEVSTNKDRLLNSIAIAATDPLVQVSTVELDAQPNDLCTPDGIVNLRTGELRAAIKGLDMNTRSTSVAPAKMPTPMWDAFLRDIIEDDDRIRYIQELFGAALFGDSRYHVLPVFVGTGANGKSTILEVLREILADYAATMPEDFLIDTKGNPHPTDIARLRGVRLAIASETRPDGKFNESRVKMLTGGDVLSARFMNQNFFDFKPTHTLFMAVNHLPEVKSGGDGFWRRLRKIDFRKTIPVERRRENFSRIMFEAEGPGILQWMIDGAVRITDQGMSEPDSIKLSTQSYRHEEDHIAKFLDEKTILADTASITRIELFSAYRSWCEENGEHAISQNQLTREVKARLGIAESSSSGFKMFIGIDLLRITSSNNASSVSEIMDYLKEKNEYWK
jgi:P4 family phage/plasmid primase-like protien